MLWASHKENTVMKSYATHRAPFTKTTWKCCCSGLIAMQVLVVIGTGRCTSKRTYDVGGGLQAIRTQPENTAVNRLCVIILTWTPVGHSAAELAHKTKYTARASLQQLNEIIRRGHGLASLFTKNSCNYPQIRVFFCGLVSPRAHHSQPRAMWTSKHVWMGCKAWKSLGLWKCTHEQTLQNLLLVCISILYLSVSNSSYGVMLS